MWSFLLLRLKFGIDFFTEYDHSKNCLMLHEYFRLYGAMKIELFIYISYMINFITFGPTDCVFCRMSGKRLDLPKSTTGTFNGELAVLVPNVYVLFSLDV